MNHQRSDSQSEYEPARRLICSILHVSFVLLCFALLSHNIYNIYNYKTISVWIVRHQAK